MGTLFSTLDIARLGMQAAQVQIDVSGHNIANANTEGYSRQRVTLGPPLPNKFSYGSVGRGVFIRQISRVRDPFLDQVYRLQVAGLGDAELRSQYYALLEDAFLEPSDQGFGTSFNQFFDTLNDFANNVEEYSVREATVAEADNMARSLNQLAQRLYDLRTQANEEVRNLIPEINSLTETIDRLNIQIRDSELDNSIANDLRDERDRALDDLAKLVNINYTERQDGQITVRIGSDTVVDTTGARELEAVRDTSLDPERDDLLRIQFVDNGNAVRIEDGELFGVLQMRDTAIPEIDERVDTIAREIIQQINLVHTEANGLVNLSGTIESAYAVTDPTDPLTAAGLPFDVTVPGSFDIALYDAAGNQVGGSPFTISVNPSDTLNDLAATINTAVADPNFSAAVTPEGRLTMTANTGYSFAFSNDSADVLTALGVNALFTGTDALTIAVSQDVLDDPGLLASGYNPDPAAAGDNAAALVLADVRDLRVLDGNNSTINDFYESTIAELGIDARAIEVTFDTETQFVEDYERRRQEVSGVSIDEEATFLMQYQRAFEGCAQVVTVVQRVLDALLGLVE